MPVRKYKLSRLSNMQQFADIILSKMRSILFHITISHPHQFYSSNVVGANHNYYYFNSFANLLYYTFEIFSMLFWILSLALCLSYYNKSKFSVICLKS